MFQFQLSFFGRCALLKNSKRKKKQKRKENFGQMNEKKARKF